MRRARSLAFLLSSSPALLLAPLACASPESGAKAEDAKPTPEAPSGPAEPAPEAKAEEGIVWIEDDWEAARKAALARGVPVVADMWAPWCHTCLSMQDTVLKDPSLEPFAARFVWLAADTDKPENAELLALAKVSMWPTFFVLDPEDGAVHGSFAGAASIMQFRAFLSDGEAAYLDAHGKELEEHDPRRLARDGARHMQARDYAKADESFVAALHSAPASWPRRPDVLVDLIRARYRGKDFERCVELAEQEIGNIGKARAASVTDFSLYANRCAGEVEAKRGEGLRRKLVEALEKLDGDDKAFLSIDDRSDLRMNLREILVALGEEERAREVARGQADLLAQAWKDASSPRVAMTYAWPRCEVMHYLGEGEKLLPELEQLEKDLPDEYDPPYRKAWMLLQLERHDEALVAIDAALAKIYGPRKVRAQQLKADIQKARGDADAHREALAEVVAVIESLPDSQRDADLLEAATKALAEAGG